MITIGRSDTSVQQLGKLLERERIVSREQWQELVQRAKHENRSVTELLFEEPSVSADRVLNVVGQHYDTPTVLLREKVITSYVLNLIPKEVAEQHDIVVFKKIQNVIHVATTNPHNHQAIDFVRRHTKLEPEVFLTTPEDLRHALGRYQTDLSHEFSKIVEDSLRAAEQSRESAELLAQHLPIINMVNTLIERALAHGASDIHLEPAAEQVVIRFRVDGLLRQVVVLPKLLLAPLVARIKLMAGLKIDEHRRPQDGRFSFEYNNRTVAIRTSAVPTLHGSKVVLRLLDARQQQFTLRSLGLNQHDYTILKQEISKPTGLLLVTGPTGSGKTTTLYTLLRMLNTEEVNICTIEDPIEYGLDGVNQTQVNPAANLTFANGLRSLLRQDPNVIMVGEIRDPDTADIAVNAAMTGHLVLSTLHTNSAAQTPQRLIEMGVPAYLAASTINVVVAQRLVRKVCRHCRVNVHLTDRVLIHPRQDFNLEKSLVKLLQRKLLPPSTILAELTMAVGKGCDKCQGSGYLGRVGIYEIIPLTEAIRAIMLRDPSPAAIAKVAEHAGLLTMIDDGLLKVFTGLTTFEEILRVTK